METLKPGDVLQNPSIIIFSSPDNNYFRLFKKDYESKKDTMEKKKIMYQHFNPGTNSFFMHVYHKTTQPVFTSKEYKEGDISKVLELADVDKTLDDKEETLGKPEKEKQEGGVINYKSEYQKYKLTYLQMKDTIRKFENH